MQKIILFLLASILVFNLGGSLILADGMILPEALSPNYLAVRYHRVTVDIADNHAVTRVEQEFYNPYPHPISGRYLFPVPPGAMLSSFQASVEGQIQTVTRQDAAATNAALNEIIAQRHDPSLLQYADWESLAFDLSLTTGASKKMILEYEQVLAPSGGMFHYRYILSTERYTAESLAEASITINLSSSKGLGALYSPSHTLNTARFGNNRAQVTWRAENIQPTEDFDLFFAPANGGFGGGLLTGRREGHNHFMFLFAPEAEAVQDNALPKDIVFVTDRSGSMSGEKIEQAQNALQFILGQLNSNDRFSIVGFDDRLNVLSPTLQPVNRVTLSNARDFVNTLYADGGTNLEAALQTGLNILEISETRSNATQIIIFLTDGLSTAGITDGGLIANLVTQSNNRVDARLHVFGVGYDVNTHLLDRLAEENSGSVTYVQPGENLELVLSDFYGRIANPVLTDVTIEFEGMMVSDLHPQQLPDMFQGSSLLLTGRYQAADSTVVARVRGLAGGKEKTYRYQFDLSAEDSYNFVPRLWATRQIGALLDQVRVKGESAALVEDIRALGLGYGLITPYTTFIIQAQTNGAASVENMRLYSNLIDLNSISGQTTIQARVQNQTYQQADQVNLASGANISNWGGRSLAQLATQTVDLSLLQAQPNVNDVITDKWIAQNIKADRQVAFASDAYFELAADPAMRPFLQSGTNVIFSYQGEVIAVQDPETKNATPTPQIIIRPLAPSRQNQDQSLLGHLFNWLSNILD